MQPVKSENMKAIYRISHQIRIESGSENQLFEQFQSSFINSLKHTTFVLDLINLSQPNRLGQDYDIRWPRQYDATEHALCPPDRQWYGPP
jgi:hypothetical protein